MDTSSEATVLVGNASFISEEIIQLKWECPGQLDEFYEVKHDQLNACAKDVRNKLGILLNACGTTRNGYVDDLVNAGINFFRAVLPEDGDRGAKRVHAWYDSQRLQATTLDIRMIWDVDVDFPWGLVFAPDPSHSERTPGPDSRDTLLHNFWCVQHRLVICKAPAVYQAAQKTLRRTDYELLSALACDLQFHDLLHHHAIADKQRLRSDLQDGCSAVIYFCCKTDVNDDGTYLKCEQFVVDADDIKAFGKARMLENTRVYGLRSTDSHIGLIFFNGCDVHVGAHGRDWRTNLFKTWDGFIDTEVPLESTSARMIFCEFTKQLLGSNRTLMSVNEHMRKTYLPMSLAYTIYCWPNYFFERHEAMPDLSTRIYTKHQPPH